jgi:RNA polymerase sigma factor (sigma-70 family)
MRTGGTTRARFVTDELIVALPHQGLVLGELAEMDDLVTNVRVDRSNPWLGLSAISVSHVRGADGSLRSPGVIETPRGRPMRDDPIVIALVARAAEGEQSAWDEIVERFAPLVWSICRRFRLADADAHDVGQNVWLRLVEYLPSLREPAALPGWLATTTRRECLRVQRVSWEHEKQLAQPEVDVPADEESTEVDRWLITHERNSALRAAFAQLSRRCRELLAMLMRDPPTPYAQISSDLHIPVGSIGPSRARCLEQLRGSPLVAALADAPSLSIGRGDRRDRRMVGG